MTSFNNLLSNLYEQRNTVAVLFGVAALGVGIGYVLGRNTTAQVKSTDSPSLSEVFNDKEDNLATTPSVGSSSIRVVKNPLTDVPKYILRVASAAPGKNSIGISEDAAIIVRCEGTSTELFLSTPEYLSSDSQTIKIRWNDEALQDQYWSGSTGGTALFSEAPRTFLKQLSTKDKVIFGYEPWREAASTAVFNLEDHRKDLKKMVTHCQ